MPSEACARGMEKRQRDRYRGMCAATSHNPLLQITENSAGAHRWTAPAGPPGGKIAMLPVHSLRHGQTPKWKAPTAGHPAIGAHFVSLFFPTTAIKVIRQGREYAELF